MIEFDPVWEDEPRNRSAIGELLHGLGHAADWAVLPEMAFSGYSMDAAPDPDVEPFLATQARTTGLGLVAGCVLPGRARPRNAVLAYDRHGQRLARYDKLHPFSFAGEDKVFEAGDELVLFDMGDLRAALFVCYDLRFPEIFRAATHRGAELLLVVANWPASRVDHWRTLLRARAMENQAFVVGVNRVGEDPNVTYASSSLAVAPDGEVLHEGAGVVTLDRARLDRWRRDFPALRDARSGYE